MELEHITGNTYYIKGDTNCGIYMLNEQQCLLVDAGYSQSAAAMVEYLHSAGVTPIVVVNTHGHVDHAGGDELIRERSGAKIYAPAGESWVIERPELEMIGLTGTPSFGVLNDAFLEGRHCQPDVMLQPGPLYIYSARLDILSLPGHSIDHMGVVTPDDVLFCGDAVFTHEFIKKYKLPYIGDVAATLNTLRFLKDTTYEYYVPSHGGVLRDIVPVADENMALIEDVIGYITDKLYNPITREDLCTAIMKHYKVWMSLPQHFLMMSYTSSFIRYLYEADRIEPIIEGYSLKWKTKAATK